MPGKLLFRALLRTESGTVRCGLKLRVTDSARQLGLMSGFESMCVMAIVRLTERRKTFSVTLLLVICGIRHERQPLAQGTKAEVQFSSLVIGNATSKWGGAQAPLGETACGLDKTPVR
jgi:hypothetical protein